MLMPSIVGRPSTSGHVRAHDGRSGRTGVARICSARAVTGAVEVGPTTGERLRHAPPRAWVPDPSIARPEAPQCPNPSTPPPRPPPTATPSRSSSAVEPTVAGAIRSELADQRESLKLIASENYASPAVLLTMGTWLSRQVRRGHDRAPLLRRLPEHRHRRAGSPPTTPRRCSAPPHAYVQPHSGIDANLVAFWAILAQRIESPGAGRRPARSTSTTCPRTTGQTLRQRAAATSARSACRWTPAATSPTASAPTSAARCSTRPPTAPTRRPACSTTTRVRAHGAGVQAADPHRRLLGLPAPGQLRDDARDRRRGRRRR